VLTVTSPRHLFASIHAYVMIYDSE
jgi:hypothetical protein